MNTKEPIQKIAIAAHPLRQDAPELAREMAEYLLAGGVQAESNLLNDESFRQRIENAEFDLLVTLGGDGTVLRAGNLCSASGTPILPVNMGRFGFLSEVVKTEWKEAFGRVLHKDYWVEDRMMLKVVHLRGEQKLGEWEFLNDAFIGRGLEVRPVHLKTSLDGKLMTTYVADGLVISTATGSTAYAMAAGGPILPPEMRNILLIPVAAHLTFDRALVLSEGSEVNVIVMTEHEAVLSVDGQDSIPLENNDQLDVSASEHSVKIIRFRDASYFYRDLLSFVARNPSTGVQS